MRKFSFVTSMAMLVTFLTAALAPAANAATVDKPKDKYGYIKVCKEQYNYKDRENFRFRIDGKNYDKRFSVRGGSCSDWYRVENGKYTIYESDKNHWRLERISGDYDKKSERDRYAEVRAKSDKYYRVTFHNRYYKGK
jgi:hypothetical protein